MRRSGGEHGLRTVLGRRRALAGQVVAQAVRDVVHGRGRLADLLAGERVRPHRAGQLQVVHRLPQRVRIAGVVCGAHRVERAADGRPPRGGEAPLHHVLQDVEGVAAQVRVEQRGRVLVRHDPDRNVLLRGRGSSVRSVNDVSELERLRRRVDEASDPHAASGLGWLLWQRRDGPDARETDLEECVEAFALAMVVDVGTFPEQLLPRIADAAAPFAAGLLERGATTADPRPVNLAVELWNRIASVLPDHAGHLSRLGIALRMQFDRTGDPERLALAVRAGETALVRADPDDPELPAMLHDVAVTLKTTYVHGGDRAELLRAVALLEEAVTVLPEDHPRRATYLSSLAAARRLRHDGDSDLRSAVRLARRAVEIGPTGDAALLSGLATALLTSFRSSGLAADLDEAVDVAGAAVASLPAGHPDAPTALADQAAALRTRFDTSGDAADLDGAIRAAGAALTAASRTEPDKAMFRATLGTALLTRYERTGRTADLAKAVRLLQDAVDATPPVHAERAVRLSHLGLALEAQARRSGDRAQLDAAVRSLRAACAAVDDPLLPMFLSNLSNVLHTRFDVVGSSTDLTEAVDALADAVAATPSAHPDLPLYLGNLAGARLTRFQHRDQAAGPEEPTDLDAAVEAGHRALDLTPADHPSRPIRQTNLGTALRTRGTCEPGGGRDLDEAVELCTAAVAGQPETDPEHPAMLSNLASSLLTRYRHGHDPADLAGAVQRLREAVRLTSSDRPVHGIHLSNLGHVLTECGARADAVKACLAAAGVDATPARVRLRAAWHAAELLVGDDPARAAAAARLAIRLLPTTVSRALGRPDQEDLLTHLSGLAGDAAALVLGAGQAAGDAVEVLEAGRVVLLGQIRDAHPDLTRLRARRPDVADRLTALGVLLDGGAVTGLMGGRDAPVPPSRDDGVDHDEDRRMRLAREWDELVAQVRDIDGFADFLLPLRLEALLPAAAGGPVVILNVSRWRCDAIVVRTTGVDVVELPELSHDDVVANVQAYLDAAGARQREGERGDPGSRSAEAALQHCLEWMWDAFAARVLDHLGHTATPTSSWPRVWWCPTGPLTLLPIHAAGRHRTDGDSVVDRVVSSYTPTLRALVDARARLPAHSPGSPRMLFVGMPTTPERSPLPNVRKEEETVARSFRAHCTRLSGERAVRATVIADLHDHTWVHFACHGEQDLTDPARGALLLHDGPLTVTALSAQQYRGEVAYLSGCETAVGGIDLPDEAITLASALHFTGFRHVIATLWSVRDLAAVRVAADVYDAVVRNGLPQADGVATALHQAVRRLRDGRRSRPGIWIPFAHTGP